MSAPDSRFVRACRGLPTDATPVWFMRQAGRYMPEYQAIRRHHSILEICHSPQLAAEVTITAAEKLGVDAAIIFADLLLPLEALGAPFHFSAGEGPVVEGPVRSSDDVEALRVVSVAAGAGELGYVAEAIRLVVKHFSTRLPVIGFCGAPFTLASYLIEGGSSRHYLHTKKMMYAAPQTWDQLMRKLVTVLADYAGRQAEAGADALQIFDSWVGCLAPQDYRQFVLPYSADLVKALKKWNLPIIYFGTDTATLLESMQEAGADVMGLDWRIDLDDAWRRLRFRGAVQGNLDPAALFAAWPAVRERAELVLQRAGGRAGHIFNLGHGILPETPVENVRALAEFVHEYSSQAVAAASRGRP